MKTYGVKEISQISGVTIRTLHHYDKIGLLKPLNRTEAGYRFYGEAELLRLQQILFYRELDFPLREIGELLDDPEFDLVKALTAHKIALQVRQERISTLLDTIDHTISHLQTNQTMSKPEKLYEGLPKEMGTTYRDQAIDKYGKDVVERSEKALLKRGKAGIKQLKEEFDQINDALFAIQNQSPQSEAVQALIDRHYAIIRAFWGTSDMEDKQAEAYAGLGQLYVHDGRYMARDGQAQPEFAQFLQEAMEYFAEHQLS